MKASIRAWSGLVLSLSLATDAIAAARLQVRQAWIRAMPPGSHMLAGYAVLHNAGEAPLRLIGVSSSAFGDASMHQTVEKDGVSTMRAMEHLDIPAGQDIRFEPGGRHLMLMMPKQSMNIGSTAPIAFALGDGSVVRIDFIVAESEPASQVSP